VITRTGWAFVLTSLLLTVVGAWANYPQIFAMGIVGLLAAIGGWCWTLRRYGFDITRTIDTRRVAVGESVTSRITITNTGRGRAPSMVLADSVGELSIDTPVSALPPSGSQTTTTVLPTSQRGVLQVGPLRIHRSDPLSLFRRVRDYGEVLQLRVHPKIVPVPVPPVGLDRSLDGEGLNELRGDMQFDSLREYVPGDDVRRIHWRSSARSTRILVREHVDVCQPSTTILIDTRPCVWSDGANFEAAVAAATSLAVASASSGHPTQFGDFSDTWARSTGGVSSMLDYATEIEQSKSSDVGPEQIFGRITREALSDVVAVFTGDLDEADARLIARATRNWSDRTCVIFPGKSDGAVPSGMPTIKARTLTDFARAWTRRVGAAA
jgi:uncharacterized protein (DUF58 family)